MTAAIPRRILDLRGQIKRLSADERLALADLVAPCEIRRLRDVEQFEAVAALFHGRDVRNATKAAGQVLNELKLYLAGAWQRDRHHDVPENPEHSALFNYLTASGGKLPSFRTMRRHASTLATCARPRGRDSIGIE